VNEEVIEGAKEAVTKVQGVDPNSVVRESELGRPFSLQDAVEPLSRLVRLFRQIPVEYISELPDAQASQLQNQAQAVLSRVRELNEFDPTSIENPTARRAALVDQLKASYPSIFDAIWHHIGYLSSRERDFAAMETEARASMEAVRQESTKLTEALSEQKSSADSILADIKQVAAETGVSQQAIHFSSESTAHENEASKWERRTIWALVAVVAYGLITIFLHKLPWISPENAYDTVQLAVSKVVIFIALFYVLTLCAKNYLAHKHSQVVNKHRQNALATYKAIADAAHDEAGRDIVLSHAADCIFSPQETGYLSSKNNAGQESPPTLQVLPRLSSAPEG
jgi:hypothetical protein